LSRYLAIDIDPQGLFVVAGSARGGAVKPDHALAWAGDDAPPPLTAATARQIGEQLKERLKAAGIQPAPVLVAVGRDRVILKELKYPAVGPAEEPALVRFQASKELTESPDDVVLDYAPLGEQAAAGGKKTAARRWKDAAGEAPERRSMAVALKKDVFHAVRVMVEAAGLKLAAVTPRPYAIAAGLARGFAAGTVPPPPQPDDAVAAVTLGTQGGEFTVVRGGQVLFTRTVPAPTLAGETLLVAEVKRNLAVYAGPPVKAVYVAEGGHGRWAGRLDGALTIPVHSVDPLAGATTDVPAEFHGRFAGAAGLLAGKAADALPINFAAPRQPKAEKDPNRKTYIWVGVAAAVVLAAGWVFGYMQLVAAEDEVGRLRTQKAQAEKDKTDLGPAAARMAAVTSWSAPEVNLLDELFDFADRFPAGDQVRVNSVAVTQLPADLKTGKREAAARLEVRVAARNPAAADDIKTGFDRDNTEKAKFYVGTQKQLAGAPQTSTAYRELFTISTRVNHRNPADYTRNPAFTPPNRAAGRNVVAAEKEKEKPAEPDPDDDDPPE
jgi:hypothetical protein